MTGKVFSHFLVLSSAALLFCIPLRSQTAFRAQFHTGPYQLSGMSNQPLFQPSGISYQLADTTVKQKPHSPKTASIMSACLPGLGQVYNKKYWKLAIIYPAMGGLAFGIGWNHHYFKVYRDALRIRYDDDPATIDQFSLYSDDRIVTMKNYYQRYRDLCVIGMTAVYILQILDAAVDAHLFYFDVGPDLSMRWGPVFNSGVNGPVTGIGIQLGLGGGGH